MTIINKKEFEEIKSIIENNEIYTTVLGGGSTPTGTYIPNYFFTEYKQEILKKINKLVKDE